jgi:ribonucleoside-diphosphate reductase beta chain
MQQDVELWKKPGALERRRAPHDPLEPRLLLDRREPLTANNLVLAIYRHITNPEARQYILRQAYEEAVHTDTFIYCCDTLGLNPTRYTTCTNHPSIKEKDEFVVDMTKNVFDPNFTTEGTENIQRFVHDLVGYYVIMEGIFFYAGFVMMLSMLRKNRMVGVGEQFQFILRDESVHLAFGADLINTIVQENPEIWTPEFKQSSPTTSKKRVELEKRMPTTRCRAASSGSLPQP